MAIDLSTPEAVTQARAEAVALQTEYDAATRELWAAGLGPEGLTADDPIAHRFQKAWAAHGSYRWNDLLVAALDALAATRQALAEAEVALETISAGVDIAEREGTASPFMYTIRKIAQQVPRLSAGQEMK